MKKIAFVFLLMFFPISMTLQAAGTYRIVTIMTFNIRREGEEEKAWREWKNRRSLVTKTINQSKAEILGIQEAMKAQKDYILSHLDGKWDVVGEGRDGGSKGEYCPIFFRKDKFELKSKDTLWYSNNPGKPSKGGTGWGSPKSNRIFTYAKLLDRSTNMIFWVFNTHWTHDGGADKPSIHRWQSAKLLLEKIRDLVPDVPEREGFIVMGDFNVGYSSEQMKFLRTGVDSDGSRTFPQYLEMADVYREGTPEGNRNWGTAHGWTGNYSGDSCRRIDFILAQRSSWSMQFSYAEIDHTKDKRYLRIPPTGQKIEYTIWPSDHFPEVATLLWLHP